MRNEKELMDFWNEDRTLLTTDDVPDIPKRDDITFFVERLIKWGAIPKNKLIVGHTYLGKCRNAVQAVWRGDVFVYKRYKFGTTYPEEINHFEDDNGYDLFVPIRDITDECGLEN